MHLCNVCDRKNWLMYVWLNWRSMFHKSTHSCLIWLSRFFFRRIYSQYLTNASATFSSPLTAQTPKNNNKFMKFMVCKLHCLNCECAFGVCSITFFSLSLSLKQPGPSACNTFTETQSNMHWFSQLCSMQQYKYSTVIWTCHITLYTCQSTERNHRYTCFDHQFFFFNFIQQTKKILHNIILHTPDKQRNVHAHYFLIEERKWMTKRILMWNHNVNLVIWRANIKKRFWVFYRIQNCSMNVSLYTIISIA